MEIARFHWFRTFWQRANISRIAQLYIATQNVNKSEADKIRRKKKWKELKLCDSKFTKKIYTITKNTFFFKLQNEQFRKFAELMDISFNFDVSIICVQNIKSLCQEENISNLLNNNVHPAQLSGHKNIESLSSYHTVSSKQQQEMSEKINGHHKSNQKAPISNSIVAQNKTSNVAYQSGFKYLFEGATLNNCTFNINVQNSSEN